VFPPGGASVGTFLNPHAHSHVHARSLTDTGHPSHAVEATLRHARVHPIATPRMLPEPRGTNLHAYPGTFLCTCSPLCWRTHLDAAGNPSLAVADFAPAAAPAMISTPPCRFFIFKVALFLP
jgi:hypothetical protein